MRKIIGLGILVLSFLGALIGLYIANPLTHSLGGFGEPIYTFWDYFYLDELILGTVIFIVSVSVFYAVIRQLIIKKQFNPNILEVK